MSACNNEISEDNLNEIQSLRFSANPLCDELPEIPFSLTQPPLLEPGSNLLSLLSSSSYPSFRQEGAIKSNMIFSDNNEVETAFDQVNGHQAQTSDAPTILQLNPEQPRRKNDRTDTKSKDNGAPKTRGRPPKSNGTQSAADVSYNCPNHNICVND